MNISEAAATELTVDTIRYYDKIGILGPLARTGTGARDFVEGDLGWLRILRCLRETGMTMADLRRSAPWTATSTPAGAARSWRSTGSRCWHGWSAPATS